MEKITLNEEFSLRPARDGDSPAAREILDSVLREYGLTPDFEDTDLDMFDVATTYEAKKGAFYVVVDVDGGFD